MIRYTIFTILSAFVANAETNYPIISKITTLKNNSYTNVTVISTDQEKVQIQHDGGTYYIYWGDLSAEDKKRLHCPKLNNFVENNGPLNTAVVSPIELPINITTLTTIDGNVYSNVTVKSITTDLHDPSIRFIHSEGVSSVAVSTIKREKQHDSIFLLAEQSKKDAQKKEDIIKAKLDEYNNHISLLKQTAKSGDKLSLSDWELILKESNKDQIKEMIGNPDSHSEMSQDDAHPGIAAICGRGTRAGLEPMSRWYYHSRIKVPPDEFKNPHAGDLVLDFKDAEEHSKLDIIHCSIK
ncbi:MAG: hypothetical protein K8R57_03380 [Verrucomicrobia bacterium]|nr:hypothetical protein [Verrucomicrobiota bacterium]